MGKAHSRLEFFLQLIQEPPVSPLGDERFWVGLDHSYFSEPKCMEAQGVFRIGFAPARVGQALEHIETDLVARLYSALQEDIAELAVAKTGDQAQPVFALYSTSLLPSLKQFLESGGRKIDAWYSTHRVVEVQFADESEFANINTIADLQALQ